MVIEHEEYQDHDEVKFRDNSMEPCIRVSRYDDMQCKAAHDALFDASQALLPLADYIEQNFSRDFTDNERNSQQLNGNKEEG